MNSEANDFSECLAPNRAKQVLARRQVIFMLRVMTYVVSYKLFWN